AVEPEIIDLICMLQKMGANIRLRDSRIIVIEGVESLSGYTHYPIVDRIEAASWACAALATDGKIKVKHARQADMLAFINKFHQAGGGFEIHGDGITFFRAGKDILPVKVETNVHPGFMTDWQQPFTLVLTQAKGSSVVHETVYEERFGYVQILNEMGADIQLFKECLGGTTCRFHNRNYSHSAIVNGGKLLKGKEIKVPDLRAGFTYVIAALVASGESKITNVQTIYRGYEFFVEKLKSLGADVREG
ncbi:MAG: UDP-N-acetylglucosamine 1-carboxyvinyltransferase, partial [Candidatus Roizmanbacteria bacterium]